MPSIRNDLASRNTACSTSIDFGRESMLRAMYPEWQQSRIVVTLGTAPWLRKASVRRRWNCVSSSDVMPRKSSASLCSRSNGTMNW